MEKQIIKDEKCGACDAPTQATTTDRGVGASTAGMHPDHSASKKRINRVKGQLDAVARMIDEREYCPDIIQQIRAATAALRGLEAEVLRGHLRGCVKKAIQSNDSFEVNDKIEEILQLLSK